MKSHFIILPYHLKAVSGWLLNLSAGWFGASILLFHSPINLILNLALSIITLYISIRLEKLLYYYENRLN